MSSEKKWFNYIIFDTKPNSKKTYIGSTVNINRRFRQHNQEIKGGAKYTKNGKWIPYIILYDIMHTKRTALSYEWHLKFESRKIRSLTPYKKRMLALENFINKQKVKKSLRYTHILFINSKYKMFMPILKANILIIILNYNDFNNDTITNYIDLIININNLV